MTCQTICSWFEFSARTTFLHGPYEVAQCYIQYDNITIVLQLQMKSLNILLSPIHIPWFRYIATHSCLSFDYSFVSSCIWASTGQSKAIAKIHIFFNRLCIFETQCCGQCWGDFCRDIHSGETCKGHLARRGKQTRFSGAKTGNHLLLKLSKMLFYYW